MTTALAPAYRQCGVVLNHHGRTFALATRLLPATARRHVWALYAFARHIDDLVDERPPNRSVESVATEIDQIQQRLVGDLHHRSSSHPLLAVVIDTIDRYDLPIDAFDRFFASMRRDLHQHHYATWADLGEYVDGSAAAIGDLMLPILTDTAYADQSQSMIDGARHLGIAFQFTNFVRDIAEDLRRGRVYLPRVLIDRHAADLQRSVPTGAERAAIAEFVAETRRHYRRAEAATERLTGRSRACIRAAAAMYEAILDEVEAADYDVLAKRHRVPTRRRLAITAGTAWR